MSTFEALVKLKINSSLFSEESVDIDFIPVSIKQIFETVDTQGPMNNNGIHLDKFSPPRPTLQAPLGHGVPPAFSGPSTTALRTLLLIKSHYPSPYVSVFQETLEPILGEETTKELLELQVERAASEELANATSAPIDSGVFGLPWILGS
ncbi:hypothetical protein RUND412_005125 [Rhizina undulata]